MNPLGSSTSLPGVLRKRRITCRGMVETLGFSLVARA
jgi:hypothetical protein